jgi:unsaturated rhamnogalacturonyl hydrolase
MYRLLLLFFLFPLQIFSQTWVDSLDVYAREKFMPPSKYQWKWQKAALLNTMVKEYDRGPADKKKLYLEYIKKAMDKTAVRANGKVPNAVASGLGMAFLARETGDKKYMEISEKIFSDYLKIKRTKEGGVSHLRKNVELWDDTIFMIGEFLIEMYRATGDEKYIDELAKQISIHREKLQDKQWGLWVHGWDSDNRSHCTFCGQMFWPDKDTRRSAEIWGRGNGWIVVTLSDALRALPKKHKYYDEFSGYLTEMISRLPEIQDKDYGHWYQLPVRIAESQNFIESSCTAMFAYGIQTAIKLGLVSDPSFQQSVDLAYQGLRRYSIHPTGKYITTMNVCKGTCIGDKKYYLKRRVAQGKPFGIGMFIAFGREYERK